MTTISAKSILASTNGDSRIDTLLLRYPRCIHSEFMTHRVFSRNAASSRAIPVEKLIQDVLDDPFVPLVWGKNQKGMQASEECTEPVWLRQGHGAGSYAPREAWRLARDDAVITAGAFAAAGYHKQIVNRLLEPFAHITVVVTSTEWSNFFALRDHPDAEPHIRMLAQAMRKAIDEADVQTLEPGQWHLPFVTDEDQFDSRMWANENRPPREMFNGKMGGIEWHDAGVPFYKEAKQRLIKLSVARCASTSYKTVDGFDMTLDRAIALHDKLVSSIPMHASPCEHQAQADKIVDRLGPALNRRPIWAHPAQSGNFRPGWIQYRKTLPGESQ